MPAEIKLKLTYEEFCMIEALEKTSYKEKDMRLYTRCRALIAYGYNKVKKSLVADSLNIDTHSINNWIRLYRKNGIEGLRLLPCGGSISKLNPEQLQTLTKIIMDGPEAYGFDTAVWTSPLVREMVIKEFAVKYDVSHIRRILEKLGFSVQYPRVHLSKADHKKQRGWLINEYSEIKKKPRKKME